MFNIISNLHQLISSVSRAGALCLIGCDLPALGAGHSLGDITMRLEKHIISANMAKIILISLCPSNLGIFISPLGKSCVN